MFWDAASGMTLDGIQARAKKIAFSPDGKVLAVGRFDGSPTLWKSRPAAACLLPAHRGGINALAFSSDGQRFATGSSDGEVRIWEAAGGRELTTTGDHKPWDPVIALGFSPDGKRLATTRLRVVCSALGPGHRRTPRPIAGVRFRRERNRVLTRLDAAGDRPGRWERCILGRYAGPGAGMVRAQGRGFLSVAFSRDGRTLATGGIDGCLRLWDVAWHSSANAPARAGDLEAIRQAADERPTQSRGYHASGPMLRSMIATSTSIDTMEIVSCLTSHSPSRSWSSSCPRNRRGPRPRTVRPFEAAKAEAGNDPAKLVKLALWCESRGMTRRAARRAGAGRASRPEQRVGPRAARAGLVPGPMGDRPRRSASG